MSLASRFAPRQFVYVSLPGACDECSAYEGKQYHPLAQNAPQIPVHPNCRCFWKGLDTYGETVVEMSSPASASGTKAYQDFKENHISGVLALPTVSRNGNFYIPSEIQRQHGKTIDVFLDHEDLQTRYNEYGDRDPTGLRNPIPPRGRVNLSWNPTMNQLEYEGELWDPEAIKKVKEQGYNKVSLAGDPQHVEPFHGLRVPLGLNFFSMAIVRDPGIPQTSLHMAAESAQGPPVAESMTQVAAKRFILMEGDLQFGNPQRQLSNAPPFNRPPVSGIEPQLARQNSQTFQTGVGFPAGTGVSNGMGIDKDPHLGGTGAVGVSGTGNVTPMAGDPNRPTAYPTPDQGMPPQMCPHNLPLQECPECYSMGTNKMNNTKEDDPQQGNGQQQQLLNSLLGYYIVTKLVHGPGLGVMAGEGIGGGAMAVGAPPGAAIGDSVGMGPGAASGVAPGGTYNVLQGQQAHQYSGIPSQSTPPQQQPQQQDPNADIQNHMANCPTCQTVHGLLFGGKRPSSEAELTSAKRDDLSDSKFAYVGPDGEGKLPVNDAAHVRNALARFNQTDLPASAKAGALAKIHSAAKRLGVEVGESSQLMEMAYSLPGDVRARLLAQVQAELASR